VVLVGLDTVEGTLLVEGTCAGQAETPGVGGSKGIWRARARGGWWGGGGSDMTLDLVQHATWPSDACELAQTGRDTLCSRKLEEQAEWEEGGGEGRGGAQTAKATGLVQHGTRSSGACGPP
jgi:hypothetical protein